MAQRNGMVVTFCHDLEGKKNGNPLVKMERLNDNAWLETKRYEVMSNNLTTTCKLARVSGHNIIESRKRPWRRVEKAPMLHLPPSIYLRNPIVM